jgi:hypothetical protein
MGFVDDDDVPTGGEGLVAAEFGGGIRSGEERDGAERELRGEKRVLRGVARFAGEAAGFVVDAEPEIEAAEQLDEPLVRERFGDENEDAFRLTDGEEALEDEAGLDGFAEAHFVGEEHARQLARGDLVENVELVRDEFEATAEETAHVGLAEFCLGLERAVAEVEDFAGVGLTGHEALLREIDARDVGNGVFAHAAAGAKIGEQAGGFLDGVDGERGAIARGEGLAGAELHAFQHRRAEGVEAIFAGGGEFDPDAFRRRIDARDHAETELGLPFTHTTLTNDA